MGVGLWFEFIINIKMWIVILYFECYFKKYVMFDVEMFKIIKGFFI